jgi:hypothetical protein
MKNKIFTLFLVVLIFTNSSLQADSMFNQTSSTSYSQWKDPNSNITYVNFGSVNFKFNKKLTSFAPWIKGRAPSVKAGCGGISLDAGFAAFLDLETIGDQLEQAISSVGMGVIVVLIQTLPSIGKAYEDIQKLVKKIQSMLQNACQLTVQGLSKETASTKKNAQDNLDALWGNSSFAKTLGGVSTSIDGITKLTTCSKDDKKCKDNALNMIRKPKSIENKDGVQPKSSTVGMSSDVSQAVLSLYTVDSNLSAKTDSISNIFSKKFDNKSLNVSDESILYYKIKLAMFGSLEISPGDGNDGLVGLDDTGKIVSSDIGNAVENPNIGPSYTVKFFPSLNSIDDIKNFLVGEGTLYIPADLHYVIDLGCAGKTTTAGGCSGGLNSFQYIQKDKDFNKDNKIGISWDGIEKNSYETILNAIDDKKYPAPAVPTGVFMPNGNKYIQIIKRYAQRRDYEKYADFLAKMNVKYAVESLMREAKSDANAMVVGQNEQSKIALREYTNNVDSVTKAVLQSIDDYSGDIAYLADIDRIFENLKQTGLQEKMKMANGQ